MFRRYALFNTSSVFYPDHISLVETLKVSVYQLRKYEPEEYSSYIEKGVTSK